MRVAFVFPGQGAQKVGMGSDFFECSVAARNVFETVDSALGESLTKLIFEGPIDKLTLTENAQPAILAMTIAALQAFREATDIQPELMAGHSLGEFSALVASEAMFLEDAARATRARGRFMQAAVPPGAGAMAAVIGDLTKNEIAKICNEVSGDGIVAPANFNAPGQIVISGHTKLVDKACAILSDRGALIIPLQVSAPFHSILMTSAAQKLDKALEDIPLKDPKIPIITNVEAIPNRDKLRIRELLVRQVTMPVRWMDTIQYMLDAGINVFVELGPGKVLSGLIRRFKRDVTTISIDSVENIESGLEKLKKMKPPC